jgi:hypothetical protein
MHTRQTSSLLLTASSMSCPFHMSARTQHASLIRCKPTSGMFEQSSRRKVKFFSSCDALSCKHSSKSQSRSLLPQEARKLQPMNFRFSSSHMKYAPSREIPSIWEVIASIRPLICPVISRLRIVIQELRKTLSHI